MPNEVYFDNISGKIAEALNTAKCSIHLAVAWFTDADLFRILCNKAKQGIIVNVICQKDEINIRAAINHGELVRAGGQICFISPQEDYMHHKFCVIDNNIVFTGSYNWTNMASFNSENVILIKDDRRVCTAFLKEFYRLFEADWSVNASVIEETELKIIERKAVQVIFPQSVLDEIQSLLNENGV